MSDFLTKDGLFAMLASANGAVPEERNVDLAPLYVVAKRALVATAGLDKDVQNMAIRLAVADFLSLATKGVSEGASLNNTDLLPIGHPNSTAHHYLSDETVFAARAEWLSADETLSEQNRDMLKHAALSTENPVIAKHAQARLRVLVASGSLSSEFATMMNDRNEPVMDTQEEREAFRQDYYSSRDAFLDLLDEQVSLSTDYSLYDTDGKITRMVNRGDSRERIEEELLKNSIFKANLESINETPSDPFEAAAQLRFKDFYQGLKDIVNTPEEVNYREAASELVEPYDNTGVVDELINTGASSYQVLKALEASPLWMEHLQDYLTSRDVELPSDDQRTRWAKFYEVVESVRDLDDYREPVDAVTAALTPNK